MLKQDLIPELQSYFFTQNAYSKSSEILLNNLFKIQNFISNEKVQILTTLGKNFPEVLTCKWMEESKNNGPSRIQSFLMASIEKIEKKKCG